LTKFLLTVVLCVGVLTLDLPLCHAQTGDAMARSEREQVEEQREHYRETLLALRDTLSVLRASMSRIRRQLSGAGSETLLSWVTHLNRACQNSIAALEQAQPTFRRRGSDRLSVAARAFLQTIDRSRDAIQEHCSVGLAPEGPGQWTDSLRAWGGYRIGRLERQLVEYDHAASRFAKVAGFRLVPRTTR
jgi:hypothetical protein